MYQYSILKKKNKKTKKSLHKLTLNLNPENQMHLIIAMSSHRSKKKKKKKKKQASSYKTQRSRDASNPAHFYSLSVSVKDSTEAEPAKHSWAAALEYTWNTFTVFSSRSLLHQGMQGRDSSWDVLSYLAPSPIHPPLLPFSVICRRSGNERFPPSEKNLPFNRYFLYLYSSAAVLSSPLLSPFFL